MVGSAKNSSGSAAPFDGHHIRLKRQTGDIAVVYAVAIKGAYGKIGRSELFFGLQALP